MSTAIACLGMGHTHAFSSRSHNATDHSSTIKGTSAFDRQLRITAMSLASVSDLAALAALKSRGASSPSLAFVLRSFRCKPSYADATAVRAVSYVLTSSKEA